MNEYIQFLINILISLILSIAVIAQVNRALFDMLQKLCPTGQQARFWQAYVKTLLCMLPLCMVFIIDIQMQLTGLAQIKMVLTTALAGLLVGLVVLGLQMYRVTLLQSGLVSPTETPGE